MPVSHSISAAQVRKIAETQESSLYQYSLHKHPLNQRIVGGHVKKVPMFYEFYAGRKLADLDALGAHRCLLFGQGFVFTGEVLGPIDSSQSAEFVSAMEGPSPNANGTGIASYAPEYSITSVNLQGFPKG